MATAITTFALAVAGKATAIAAQLGVTGLGASKFIFAVAFYGTQALAYTGASLAAATLAAPDVPKPESFNTPYRSGRSPRVSAYGRPRVGSSQMVFA